MDDGQVTIEDSALTEGTAGVVERNVRVLLERRSQVERLRSAQDRVADRITRFTGSMPFVYMHIAVFGTWIALNTGWLPFEPFDPTFVALAMVASVEAIFLSTFVLISQNRMAELADRRAELALQVSLLTEHEVTRLVGLVTDIAKKMRIEGSHDPELSELSRRLAPEKVLDKLEQSEREHGSATH